MNPLLPPAPRRVALAVWGAAILAYVTAVAARTSFGVAGLEAMERYDVSASVLSLFVVLQLGVYSFGQVPAGILLDRFGSRRMIASGATILACAQLLMAFAEALPLAVAARALTGLGDAAIFVSVLRLIPAWFAARRVPVLTQLTAMTGQLGQVVSAVPFLALLTGAGWSPAFGSLAGLVALGVLAVLFVVRDRPAGVAPRVRPAQREVPMAAVLREPGMWLGFFTHLITASGPITFTLLWGVPFLSEGQEVPTDRVGLLLVLLTLCGVVSGPAFGVLTARHPLRRSWLVLGTVALMMAAWASVLVPAGPRPLWQLALFAVILGLGPPASGIAFDFARTFVPGPRLGTATGMVNIGGFSAAVVAIFLIGAVLDLADGAGMAAPEAYRLAMGSQTLVWGPAILGLLIARTRARRRMAEAGIVVPPVREVLARRRNRRPQGGEPAGDRGDPPQTPGGGS